MPSYTVILGGLKHDGRHIPHGGKVDLDIDEAKAINKRHEVVRLTKALEAEAEAKKKGAKAAKEAEEEAALLAKLEAEEAEKKAKAEAEAKKKGGDK